VKSGLCGATTAAVSQQILGQHIEKIGCENVLSSGSRPVASIDTQAGHASFRADKPGPLCGSPALVPLGSRAVEKSANNKIWILKKSTSTFTAPIL
jgi:hypothetical protein